MEKHLEEILASCPLSEATNTILGKDIEQPGNVLTLKRPYNKIAVYGAAGTGKTKFIDNSIIQHSKHKESFVITDVNGEHYNCVAEHLKNNGYVIKVLNLADLSKSDSWNPLSVVIDAPDELKSLYAQKIADAIISNSSSATVDPFWNTAEMCLLHSLILLVTINPFIPSENKTLPYVFNILSGDQTEMENMAATMLAQSLQIDEAVQPCHPLVKFAKSWSVYIQMSEEVRKNVIIGLAVDLQIFQAPKIRNIVAPVNNVNCIDFVKMTRSACAYFVVMPVNHSMVSVLASLFVTCMYISLSFAHDKDILNFIKGRSLDELQSKFDDCFKDYLNRDREFKLFDVPVNVMLDEFTSVGYVPSFEKFLKTTSRQKVNTFIAFQSIHQLQDVYGKELPQKDGVARKKKIWEWGNILRCFDIHYFLGCRDAMTADYINTLTRKGMSVDDVAKVSHEYPCIIDNRASSRKTVTCERLNCLK